MDRGPGTGDQGPRTNDQGPRTKDQGPRTNDQGPRTPPIPALPPPGTFAKGSASPEPIPGGFLEAPGRVGPLTPREWSLYVPEPSPPFGRPRGDARPRRGGPGP